ncbi:MAG: hypothetical protein ACYC1M_09295 [Armatimonadota bacterium]
MKATTIIFPIALMAMLPLATIAQQAPATPAAPAAPVATEAKPADANVREINAALTEMAAQFNATIKLDPALKAVVKPAMDSKTFEEALTTTLKPLENVKWRKVYLRDKMAVPDAPKLVAMVRAMMTMEASGIMMQEESGTKVTSYVKGADVPVGYQSQLPKMTPAFQARPIYVVFTNLTTVRDLNQVVSEMNSTNAGQASPQLVGTAAASLMSSLGNMSADERTQAGKSIMNAMVSLDSKTRVQFFSGLFGSLRNMTPEERTNLGNTFRSDRQTAKDLGIRMGGPRFGGPGRGGPRGGGAPVGGVQPRNNGAGEGSKGNKL